MRPVALRPNGKIGVVSTASCVDGDALVKGCAELSTTMGCEVTVSPIALERDGDFAGGPGARTAALMEIWQREDVDAIVCARGGYGSNYLLPLMDFDFLRRQPKAFVGYSDNTSILLALDRAGIVSFHGPMVASDFACGRADEISFRAALRGEKLDFDFAAGSSVNSLIAGEARGTITGGCLSVVVASVGTPWEIATEGKILFLEDVNEKPFRVDRMLMQLLLAKKLCGVRGIIFGKMLGCSTASEEESVREVIRRIVGVLGIPVVFGFPSGHVESGNLTLPFGVPAVLRSSEAGVRLQVEASTLREDQVSNS
ncbi:MAG TPA: LD-carboxypeptidase [Candidatus Saccharimonadales bacterium]|nr:LD-carboxypeptidase [Candidatus Saccharimonadales bacterium]